ncbi:MAG: hypothetical protein ABSG14_12115 [Verrucomicrobiia bacterium]|jgi:hypothetical protein
MTEKQPKSKRKQKTGPKEERLKITVPVEAAIKASFAKKKPKGGWPI